jgi:uncharacterized protein
MATLPASSNSDHAAIAPAWHTVIILFLLLLFSLMSARGAALPGMGPHGRVRGYILIMVFEWIMVAFIWYGISRRGVRMYDLVAGRWTRPAEFFRDFALAIVFLLVCGVGLANGLAYLLKAKPDPALVNMFPHTPTEIVFYLLVSLTAGFCEEVIFRGYCQRQFAALSKSTAGGIILQGIAFGAGHGYQGWKFVLIIAVYGITFGLLVQWRRSLRPGMIAHFVQDGVGGIVNAHFMH